MSTVVGLRGIAPPSGHEPHPELIKRLEELLTMARSGQLRGIAAVTLTANDGMGTEWDGDGDNRMLLSGVTYLGYRLAKNLDE